MREFNIKFILIRLSIFLLFSCESNSSSEYKKALTFYASFDKGTTADFALGDANIYTANGSYVDSKRKLEDVQSGMHNSNHAITAGKGRFGDAFEFGKQQKSKQVIFYKSKDNISYNSQKLSGSISFWLSVDPSTDLKGYTDPIQITDANYNDASIWVDFTDDTPPNFRLGVIGDKSEWTLDTLNSAYRLEFEKRLVTIVKPSFSRSKWTHVLISYQNLGTKNSLSKLYLDGELKGTVEGIDDHFTWDLEKSNIFLGLGFTGLMDDFAIFNRPFSDTEAMEIYQLKEGIKQIF